MARTACCNVCTDAPFCVPWDEVGVALMAQHMLAKHGIRTDALDQRGSEDDSTALRG